MPVRRALNMLKVAATYCMAWLFDEKMVAPAMVLKIIMGYVIELWMRRYTYNDCNCR